MEFFIDTATPSDEADERHYIFCLALSYPGLDVPIVIHFSKTLWVDADFRSRYAAVLRELCANGECKETSEVLEALARRVETIAGTLASSCPDAHYNDFVTPAAALVAVKYYECAKCFYWLNCEDSFLKAFDDRQSLLGAVGWPEFGAPGATIARFGANLG